MAAPLVAMVAVTALVVLLELPPAQAEFRQYRVAEIGLSRPPCYLGCLLTTTGDILASCDRDPNCVAADDHASEIRINYSLGAIVLSLAYLWAVTGWTPRRRRPLNALA
jgi:hypothetical protein